MAKPSKNFEIRTQIIARAWKDPAFKKKLLSDPAAAFKEMGYPMTDVKIRVVEDNANTFTFVLPLPPANVQTISEKELEKVVGAGYCTK